MSHQERLARGKNCPRECGNKIKTGEHAQYNAVSRVDGLLVCPGCFYNEILESFYGEIK